MDGLLLWAQLIVGALVIIFTGARLTRYADVFSEKLGLGQAFVGMVFLGWVTSLPEMVMSLSAVFFDSPGAANLSVGNISGSIYFNVFVLAFMELVLRRGSICSLVKISTILPIIFATMMSVLVILGFLFSGSPSPLARFANNPFGINISIITFLILALYGYSTWLLHRHEAKTLTPPSELTEEKLYGDWSLGLTFLKAALSVAAIIACGVWVASTADTIAEEYALSKGFVGTVFLAVISSLPEFTTTIAAGRMGRFDMAVGNVFGSNIFNVMILGLADLFYRQNSLYSAEGLETGKHLVMFSFGILLSLVFMASLSYASKRSFKGIGWGALIITILYVGGLVVFYFV